MTSPDKNSPDHARFVAAYVQHLKEEAAALESFAQGPVFLWLVSSLSDSTMPRAFGDNDWAYNREETKRVLGWETVSDEDIERFLKLVLNPDSASVEAGSRSRDSTCSFENVSFGIHGLDVWMMFGQGTAWTIANRPSAVIEVACPAVATDDAAAAPPSPQLSAGIDTVLQGLFGRAAEDSLAAFASADPVQAERALLALQTKHDYQSAYFALAYPTHECLSGLARIVYPGSELARFIIVNSNFVENQVERFICQHEGRACCVDKTRFVIKGFLRQAATGVPLTIDYGQQHTFHLPKKVLISAVDVQAFLQATMNLYYGRVDEFVRVRDEIASRIPPDLD